MTVTFEIVDSDELQLKDETNHKWAKAWKKAVKPLKH